MKKLHVLLGLILVLVTASLFGQQQLPVYGYSNDQTTYGHTIYQNSLIVDLTTNTLYKALYEIYPQDNISLSIEYEEVEVIGGGGGDLGDFQFDGSLLEVEANGEYYPVIESKYENLGLGYGQNIYFPGGNFGVTTVKVTRPFFLPDPQNMAVRAGESLEGTVWYNYIDGYFYGKTANGDQRLDNKPFPLDSVMQYGDSTGSKMTVNSLSIIAAGNFGTENILLGGDFGIEGDPYWNDEDVNWAIVSFNSWANCRGPSSDPITNNSVEIIPGKTYKVTYKIRSSGMGFTGSLTPWVGGTAGTTITAPGEYVDEITATNDSDLSFVPSPSVTECDLMLVRLYEAEPLPAALIVHGPILNTGIESVSSADSTVGIINNMFVKVPTYGLGAYPATEISTGGMKFGVSDLLTTSATLADTITLYMFNPQDAALVALLPEVNAANKGRYYMVTNYSDTYTMSVTGFGTDEIGVFGNTLSLDRQTQVQIINSGNTTTDWVVMSKRTYIP